MRSRSFFAAIAVVLAVEIGAVIGLLAEHMAPVHEGRAICFWEGVCRADLDHDGDSPGFVDAYFVDDQWCVYDIGHLHGSSLYKVPTSEVTELLPEVSRQIETNAPVDLSSWVLVAHARWRDGEHAKDARALVREINDQRDRFWACRDGTVLASHIESRDDFWRRWATTKWYWATIAFDWSFLSGWVLFLLWPGIMGLASWRWCLHLALAPPMFILPVYLGYSSYTFTSAGPTGGVLYPHILWAMRGGTMSETDMWCYEHLPPILSSISTAIGTPIALTGMGMPSITGVAEFGAVLGGSLWVTYFVSKRTLLAYLAWYGRLPQ